MNALCACSSLCPAQPNKNESNKKFSGLFTQLETRRKTSYAQGKRKTGKCEREREKNVNSSFLFSLQSTKQLHNKKEQKEKKNLLKRTNTREEQSETQSNKTSPTQDL